MSLDVRRTTPFSAEDYEQVRVFASDGTPEHEALERLTPVPLREGSEGSTLRALTLLGMAYVREREDEARSLALGYEDLAAERYVQQPTSASGLRANMARRARDGAVPA